ncbi:hypothetical protein ACJRO7_033489 [Eucalyptus globulus]|uniref:Ysc84 actin-binding domain-containing protein n=1 Tax=Eucalyptus globulus TaxID=34317 RepID=A0ABD3JLJ4_EUCGL
MDLELHMLDGFFGDLPEASDVIGACSSTNALSSSPDSGLSWFIENILMKDNEDGRVAGGGIRADSSQEFCDRFLADVLVDSPGDGSAEIADGSGDKEEPGSSSDGWVEAAKVDGANVGGEAYDPASKKLRREDGSWSPPSTISSCGIGWGAKAGGELTDFVMVLRTTKAVKTFGGTAHFSVGASLSAAVGPIGRAAEADV